MDLSNLKPAEGAVHSGNFRRGRGFGSGNGKQAGKGHKGQKARSGQPRIGFEGGQMPLVRRVPKFGFNNINRVEYRVINLSDLEELASKLNVSDITIDVLRQNGLASKNDKVKILGNGKLTKKLVVEAKAFSASAKAAIESLGGEAKVL